jgi:hypothetical protein
MKKVFLNLTNGLLYDGSFDGFIRIQSTRCERKQWEELIKDIDNNFLMWLALGKDVVVVDYSARKKIPRALYQGMEWIWFACCKAWNIPLEKVFVKKCNCIAYFEEEWLKIDDKTKNDHWVPSSEKADAQIVQGLGIHPSQFGLATEGGKMGSGSGSDQRESYNTAITINTPEQELLLEPLNWIAQYNAMTDPDWDVVFFIDHTQHTTTNDQESGLKPSPTTLTIE